MHVQYKVHRIYKYRDTLVIPPLQCVNDQLLMTCSGLDSLMTMPT